VTGDRATWFARDAERVPWWERGAPLRAALHWLVGRGAGGRHLVHAAAVGDDAGGVLIGGAGGSGKSTLALACAAAGLGYAGDDYVLLAPGPPPVAHALYSSAKATAETLRRVPAWRGQHAEPGAGDDKTVLQLAPAHPEVVRRRVRLRGVVLPSVDPAGRGGGLEPVAPAQALLALAPSSLLQLPGARQEALSAIGALVRTLPCWRLALGDDLDRAVAEVRRAAAP
jgi:hypothetical protein